MSVEDLVVFKRTERVLFRMYPILINYPKSEKFALSQQIKIGLIDMLKYISLGNSVPSKRKTYLQEADANLQVLKILMRLSHKQRYVTKGLFDEMSLEFTEINKMLSGYIRSTRR